MYFIGTVYGTFARRRCPFPSVISRFGRYRTYARRYRGRRRVLRAAATTTRISVVVTETSVIYSGRAHMCCCDNDGQRPLSSSAANVCFVRARARACVRCDRKFLPFGRRRSFHFCLSRMTLSPVVIQGRQFAVHLLSAAPLDPYAVTHDGVVQTRGHFKRNVVEQHQAGPDNRYAKPMHVYPRPRRAP